MLLRSCGKEVAFDVVLVFSCGIHQASRSTGVFLDRLSWPKTIKKSGAWILTILCLNRWDYKEIGVRFLCSV